MSKLPRDIARASDAELLAMIRRDIAQVLAALRSRPAVMLQACRILERLRGIERDLVRAMTSPKYVARHLMRGKANASD